MHDTSLVQLISSQRIPMAQLCLVFFISVTTLVLLISSHHAHSLVSPTSTSTVAFLSKHNNATDQQALLSFKSMMISSDPRGPLALWNESTHFCQWLGVTCSGRRHSQRVISLSLSSLKLVGFISPMIANLTFLRKIDLSNNQIHGHIPQEIGSLFQLQHLNLSMNFLEGGIPPPALSGYSNIQIISMHDNMLQGEIPSSLSNCLDLRILQLANNNLTGHVPSLANLSSLSSLSIYQNQLTGSIPPAMGNLHSLVILDLSENQLSGGIPPSLGKLSKLGPLVLFSNQLTGSIPTSLWNVSSLFALDLSQNYLSGSLPPNAGQALPLLQHLHLYDNQIHGPIPLSMSNASQLQLVELNSNSFSGTIPLNLGYLKNLQYLILGSNKLRVSEAEGWSFLTSLTNCTELQGLELDHNNLDGMLPSSIGNLTVQLEFLTMGSNYISGHIPNGIGNLVKLEKLDMGLNFLIGLIPASVGMLRNLHFLNLHSNKLSGEILSTIGNLTQLTSLFLHFNELRGNIPANLEKCQNLNELNLEHNKFTGSIPREIFTISRLSINLGLAHNLLTGSIPSEVGTLRNLAKIDVRMNKLSGEILISLGECQELEQIYLGGNFFHGNIPSPLSALKGVQELDLSQNNLSGQIPDFLQNFHFLYYLNLSFNNFEGEVPSHGVFANISAVSVLGNTKLCGGNTRLQLPPCSFRSAGKNHRVALFAAVISVASTFLCLFVIANLLYWVQKRKRESTVTITMREQHARISYADLARGTNGFSTDNLIGVGSFGAVYKGKLDDDITSVAAVKVLNLQQRGASKSFMRECEALRSIRHRNLVRILTVCSSVDFRGNDFKAMVFEFMANGNLDYWLHPIPTEQCETKELTCIDRLNIATDVASALDYLHHHSEIPIIHCDIKPSNILLDDDMIAHVGDFGLARFFKKTSSKYSLNSTSSTGLNGTIGYIAPEYGMGISASTKGDMYSYGILLLEMFTGKRPTDDTFRNGMCLRKYAQMDMPEQVSDVVDVRLLKREDNGANDDDAQVMDNARTLECVALLLRIGLLCSNELPINRPEMGDVIKELHAVRDLFLRSGVQGEVI